mgnify:CR=1 FL=1
MISLETRRKILITILVALVLLLLWFLWSWWSRRTPTIVIPQAPVASQTIKETPVTPPSSIIPVTPGVASAQVVARDFVERFSTYSTDTPYLNYSDVEELTTPEFFASLKKQKSNIVGYKGVTARVLSISVVSGSETAGTMVFELTTQNESFENDRANPTTSYEKVKVTVEKRNGLWKVSTYLKS